MHFQRNNSLQCCQHCVHVRRSAVPAPLPLWCPERRDYVFVPWSFQHVLNVFLEFCKRKRENVSNWSSIEKEALAKNAEESFRVTPETSVLTRFETDNGKDKMYIACKEEYVFSWISAYSWQNCFFFLQFHALKQVILTKKPEFHPARPSSTESTTEWLRWWEENANQSWGECTENKICDTIWKQCRQRDFFQSTRPLRFSIVM